MGDSRGAMDATSRVRSARHWAFLPQGRLASIRGEVERVARPGFGVLVPQIFAPPWAALGAAAACDEDIELASGIAMAFVRSPLETAMAALDLDRLSGGRFTLGLGSSVRAWNEDRFGVDYDRPVARLRELVGLVKRMVTIDEQPTIGRFEGEFWTVDLAGHPPAPSEPVDPADHGRPAAGGDDRDGGRGRRRHSRSPGVVAALDRRRHARGRRARAGPLRPDRATCGSRRGCGSRSPTTSSRAAATPRRASRSTPRCVSTTRTSPALDLAADARRLQDLAEAGAPPAELAAAVSDALADELVMIGPPPVVAAQVASVLDVVDDVCITPPNGLPPERTRHYDDAIADHLLPGGRR